MLSLKFKRTSPTDSTDGSENAQASWAGPSSLPAEMPTTVPVSTRELRTRAEVPTSPPVATLFSRDSEKPQQTLAIWDPSTNWPGFSLASLALSAHGRISEVSLVQEQAPDARVARIRSTVLPTPSGQPLGVLDIEADYADTRSLSVAMTLLEQADRAVILAGANADKDLIRRIGEFVRNDSWRGPSLLLVSPADKPSRADRLRRAGWPRGMKIHVLELFAVNEPGWSQQLISLVTGYTNGDASAPPPIESPQLDAVNAAPKSPVTGPAPVAPAQAASLAAPADATPAPTETNSIKNPTMSVKATVMPRNTSDSNTEKVADRLPAITVPATTAAAAVVTVTATSTRNGATPPASDVSETGMTRVLNTLSQGAGVSACAVVNVEDARLLSTHVLTEEQLGMLESAAKAGTAMWRAHRALGAGQPMVELIWGGVAHHHVMLPVPRQPGVMLLACVEREFGDLASARWQMSVARNRWI